MPANRETRFGRLLAEFDKDPEYAIERVLIEVTEAIATAMKDKGVSRRELAERMGVKPPVITRFLNGAGNTTLKTLLRMAFALDIIIDLELGRPEAVAARRATRDREQREQREQHVRMAKEVVLRAQEHKAPAVGVFMVEPEAERSREGSQEAENALPLAA